jgi:hypothetical protein
VFLGAEALVWHRSHARMVGELGMVLEKGGAGAVICPARLSSGLSLSFRGWRPLLVRS